MQLKKFNRVFLARLSAATLSLREINEKQKWRDNKLSCGCPGGFHKVPWFGLFRWLPWLVSGRPIWLRCWYGHGFELVRELHGWQVPLTWLESSPILLFYFLVETASHWHQRRSKQFRPFLSLPSKLHPCWWWWLLLIVSEDLSEVLLLGVSPVVPVAIL